MKKHISLIVVLILISIAVMSGCMDKETIEQMSSEVSALEEENEILKGKLNELNHTIIDNKDEIRQLKKEVAVYKAQPTVTPTPAPTPEGNLPVELFLLMMQDSGAEYGDTTYNEDDLTFYVDSTNQNVNINIYSAIIGNEDSLNFWNRLSDSFCNLSETMPGYYFAILTPSIEGYVIPSNLKPEGDIIYKVKDGEVLYDFVKEQNEE